MTREIDTVLRYWHSVEFFNSFDLEDRVRNASAGKRALTDIGCDQAGIDAWRDLAGQTGDLYLVPFDVSAATELIEKYVAARAGSRSTIEEVRDDEMAPEGLTCFARVTLGEGGRMNFDTLSVSTLPWALGRLREGALDDLCEHAFESAVATLKDDLVALVSACDGAAVEHSSLMKLVKRLHSWAGYAPDHNALALMVASSASGRWAKAPDQGGEPTGEASSSGSAEVEDAPENGDGNALPILNSFFFHDLSLARRALKGPNPPRALAAYLALADPTKRDFDTQAGQQEILKALRPRRGIAGRWPSAPVHFQSLMQQYALNKMNAMAQGEVLAVNGPPGTGKTTLLRDLIAHLVVERAKILASFGSWKDGLSGETVEAVFGKKTYTVALLAPSLTGFEIVVASTNNGAVENLSLELPQCKHIDPALIETLRYFQPVAMKYAGSHERKPWKRPEQPVWGLVSAALGKTANRTRFKNVFQHLAINPNDKPGERSLSNESVNFDSWDATGAMTYWRYRCKFKKNRNRFHTAQRCFAQAQADYDAEFKRLDQLDTRLCELETSWLRIAEWCPDAPIVDLNNAEALAERLAQLAARFDEEARLVERRLGPSFLRRLSGLIRPSLYARWCEIAENAFFVRGVREEVLATKSMLDRAAVTVWDHTDLSGKRNQSRAFWQSEKLNDLRNKLFAKAIALHEAFFLEAQSNDLVFALSDMLSRAPEPSSRKALWQWFFMLTPVVSTTFASVHRQFAGLGPEDLGWLVIDEAGQAGPQAAVGAIMRAQRVVVVGDPLQIQPVVTQSTRLLARLGEHWLDRWRARYAVDSHSVQTLADRCYPLGVRHPIDADQFIGIPLVMHRRCDNPMFDIANAIAYNGRMQHAKKGGTSPHPILGFSDWWHVGGASVDGTKYIAEQGRRVFEALVELYVEGSAGTKPQLPDVFLITPFREVESGLHTLLNDSKEWKSALLGTGRPAPAPADLFEWLKKALGTVHRFQGKESDVVFFVLGCDADRLGAVDWASSEPNLLNVAVTRAKSHLYIVGDRNLWGGKQYFETTLAILDQHNGRAARTHC